jgi:ring-1,2-phenylacetyl-CoA epoxidase subunit PaaD
MIAAIDQQARARMIAGAVPDPEIPVLTIDELGILRDVQVESGRVQVNIIPTYSGCPAMNVIAQDIESALRKEGFRQIEVKTLLSPAWTTDFMTEAAKGKLKQFGIAPPARGTGQPNCPLCGSSNVEKISQFGSTACKALWRCKACREPFDYFKCL